MPLEWRSQKAVLNISSPGIGTEFPAYREKIEVRRHDSTLSSLRCRWGGRIAPWRVKRINPGDRDSLADDAVASELLSVLESSTG
jgi:hypothetical protein